MLGDWWLDVTVCDDMGVLWAGEASMHGTEFFESPITNHESPPRASALITAFRTCNPFSAPPIAMQFGESITASVALTLRRSGRQWENTPLLVSAILASSTMKWRYWSRIGFSASQLPKYGIAPQLLA